jgi:hypothetical protein
MNLYDTLASAMRDEAVRAASKHAPMHSHHEAKSVIEEELDEYWDLVKLNPNKPMVHPTKGYPLTVVQWRQELRDELVQVGAMCVRALHDLCAIEVDNTEMEKALRELYNRCEPTAGSQLPPMKDAGEDLRVADISLVGGMATNYSVYFHCGCSRTPNAGGTVTDRRCADNSCQRFGRR